MTRGRGWAGALTACAVILAGTPGAAVNAVNAVAASPQHVEGCGLSLPPAPKPAASPAARVRSVVDFGARPDDDVADDAAILRALAASRPGDWVVFPPGRYLQAHALHVHSAGVTLYGAGAELHATDPAEQTLGVRASGVRVIGFRLSAVTGKRQTTPDSARLSVMPAHEVDPPLQDVAIRDNTVLSGASAGVYVARTERFTVAGNRISGTLADGIHVTGGAQRGRIVDNLVRATGDDGVAVVSYLDDARPVREVLIARNDVEDMRWGRGIATVGGEGITVQANRVRGIHRAAGILVAREDGWRTRAARRVLVEDNVVEAVQAAGAITGHAAIELHALGTDVLPGVQEVAVQGNRVALGGTDGVRVGADSAPGTVREVHLAGNRIDAPHGEAVAVLVAGAVSPGHTEGARLDCAALPQ